MSLGYDIRNYSWWKPRADCVVYAATMCVSSPAMPLETYKMSFKNKYLVSALVLAGAAANLAGCKQVPMLPGLGAHKIDIQQGNAVTQEMVAKLQPGMTRNQVRFALGTPLLIDPFRSDRWDYFYSYMKGGEVIEQRRLIVFFKDDKLDRMEGDVIAAKPVAEKPAVVAPKPDVTAPAAKPAVTAPETKPAAAEVPVPGVLTTGDGQPVGSNFGTSADKPVEKPVEKPAVKPAVKPIPAAAAKPEVKEVEKPKQERGFFGRMLDKIGP